MVLKPRNFSQSFVRIILRTSLALAVVGLVLVGLLGTGSQTALATSGAINPAMNFQGRLLNAAGAVVADGNYNMQFKIYKDGPGNVAGDTGGTLLWTEQWINDTAGAFSNTSGVVVKNGYFSVNLGTYCGFGAGTCQGVSNVGTVFDQSVMWLSMTVAGSPDATLTTCTPFSSCASGEGEMLPMKTLGAAPFAETSQSCISCLLQAPTSTAQNTITPTGASSGLTVNGSATATLAVNVLQSQAADGLNVALSSAGTNGNGLLVSRAVAGTTTNALAVTNATGTTVNGLAITNSSGTITSGITLTQSGGSFTTGLTFAGNMTTGISFGGTNTTDITRASGVLSLVGTGGASITAGTTTAITIDSAGAGSVLLGNANATTVTLGNTAATTTSIQGNTAINIGTLGTAGSIALGGTADTGQIDIGNTGNISAETVTVGTGGTGVKTITVGGSAANVITIGNTQNGGSISLGGALTTGSATFGATTETSGITTIQGGNGTGASAGLQLSTAAAGDINIGTTTHTGKLTIGQSTAGETINIGNGNVASGKINTINIGATATSTGKDVVTIGSPVAASSTTVQGGTAGTTINATAGALTLSTTTSGAISVTSAGTLALSSTDFVVSAAGDVTTGIWQGTAVDASHGGTGQTVYAVGDLLFASTTTALSRLAVGTGSQCLIGGATPSWGACGTGDLLQIPTANSGAGSNAISPASGIVGLTVNGAAATTAVGAIFVQGNNAAVPGDTVQASTTNTTGTSVQVNGILFNRNGAGGTTTNGINVTNTAGTLTNGLTLTATTAIANGIFFTGAGGFTTDLINATNFKVSNAGAVTAVGLNSGTGQIQGSGGLNITASGAGIVGTTSINTSGAATTALGSAAAGVITLQSASTITLTGTTVAIVGAATVSSTLVVTGTIDSTAGFKEGGVAGISLNCGTDQSLNDATISGGIVTAGSCTDSTSWTNLPRTNSFSVGTDINSTAYTPNWRLLPDGDVEIRGALQTPSGGFTDASVFSIGTAGLPTPTTNTVSCVVTNTTGNQVGHVIYRPNGNFNLKGNGFLANSDIWLDGCILPVNGS